jgi:hypothetical protein
MCDICFQINSCLSDCRFGIGESFGFTASQVKTSLIMPFLLEFSLSVLVQKFDSHSSLRRILPSASMLSRHTNLFHIRITQDGTVAKRHIWTHQQFRPWGNSLPVQYTSCHCIRPWMSSKCGSTLLFACRGNRCPQKLSFIRPRDFEWLGNGVNGGRWMSLSDVM